MPSRLLRDGLLDSERIDSLSAEAERFYVRLLLVSDDAGRTDARPAVLRSRCFPLRKDFSLDRVESWLKECETANLLTRYVWDRTPYVQIARVQRYGRGERSHYPWQDGSFAISYTTIETKHGSIEYVTSSLYIKTPPIPSASQTMGIQPMQSTVYVSVPVSVKKEGESEGRGGVEFEAFWQAYPKKVGKKAALKAWRCAKDRPELDALLAKIAQLKETDQWKKDGGQFIPNPATFLNQGRWDDQPTVVVGATRAQANMDRLFNDYLAQLPGLSRDDLERLCDKAAKELPVNRVRYLRETWGKERSKGK